MAQAHTWDRPHGYGPPRTIKDPLHLQFLNGMIHTACPLLYPTPFSGGRAQTTRLGRCHCHFWLVSHFILPIRSLGPYHAPISWFLDNPELGWTPPQTLVDWIAKARADDKPIVYIGFGSITVPNPKLVTERLIRGVLKS